MSYPNEHSARNDDQAARVDLFRPHSLTPEEAELMKRLRYESAWKRGYPLAIIVGGAVAFGTRNMNRIYRIGLSTSGAIFGNIVGKLSYLPTIQKKLVSELPESSPLRQKIIEYQQKGPSAFANSSQQMQANPNHENEDHGTEFDTGSEYDQHNIQRDSNKPAAKKYMTYEELRRRNREGVASRPRKEIGSYNQTPAVAPMERTDDADSATQDNGPSLDPPQRVRYNKYGDAILEQ